jgi:hypothetical protein
MILSEQEYLSYLKVHIELLFYCYCKMKGIKDGLSFEKFNRVGSEGLFPPLSSHTTVRAVRHTAVRKDTDLE